MICSQSNVAPTEICYSTAFFVKAMVAFALIRSFDRCQNTVNLPKRLAGINIFFHFSWAKNGHFLTFKVIKNFKMRVLLEIRVLLEGESY